MVKPKVSNYLTGDLYAERKNSDHRFQHISVNYLVQLQFLKPRKVKHILLKHIYSAAFVCFTTKRIHLELVSDITLKSILVQLMRLVLQFIYENR